MDTVRYARRFRSFVYRRTGLGWLVAVRLRFLALKSYLIPVAKNKLPQYLKALKAGSSFYVVHERNRKYLISMMSVVLNKSPEELMSYFDELESDSELRQHFLSVISTVPVLKDFYGDKVGYVFRGAWYVACRALKPKTVVEIGVDTGVGSCVLALALHKNNEEVNGTMGRYFGLEIAADKGMFFREPYSNWGEIIVGEATDSISKFDRPIDLFIQHGNHGSIEASKQQVSEFNAAKDKLSKNALVIGMYAHLNENTLDFATAANRRLLYFREEPKDHFRSGASLAFAY